MYQFRCLKFRESNSSTFPGGATIVGFGGDVTNFRDFHSEGLKSTDRGFSSASRSLNFHTNTFNASNLSFFSDFLGGFLCGEGRALPGPLETDGSSGSPANRITVNIGDRNGRIVVSRLYVSNAIGLCHNPHLKGYLNGSGPADIETTSQYFPDVCSDERREKPNQSGGSGSRTFAGHGLARTLASTSVTPGTLSANWQSFLVTVPAIGTNLLQTLDVAFDLISQFSFDNVFGFDNIPHALNFVIRKFVRSFVCVDLGLIKNFLRPRFSDSVYISECNLDPFVGWNFNSANTHVRSPPRNQPCRCLWRGSELQITRTTPFRRIILQSSQRLLTEALTFILKHPTQNTNGKV
jgi:hypothetical protein